MYIDGIQVKQWIMQLTEKVGYRISPVKKTSPVDIRTSEDHPVSFFYRYPNRTLLFSAPVELGTGLFDYQVDIGSRLSKCLRQKVGSPEFRYQIKEVLQEFYETWQPTNAAEWFSLKPGSVPALAELDAWVCPWPWEAQDVNKRLTRRRQQDVRENAAISGKKLGIEDGWKFCGPVSNEKLEIEVERFFQMFDSIMNHGYHRHDRLDGDILASVLCHPDGQWRWLVTSGQHRYIVLSALGYDRIPIRVTQFIWRRDVLHWPNVVRGIFTPEAALSVFDRSFS